MSFVNIGDIAKCAEGVYKLYMYGWSSVKNASAQYHEFGQDVYRLHENMGQLKKVFQSVQARSTQGMIPPDSEFFNTRSLNSILDEPHATIEDCKRLLRRRDSFSEDRGAIRNILWNVTIEAEVTQLHNKVKFHNVKILALLKPLEIKLLLDIRSMVQDYGDQLLSKLSELEARLFGDVPAVSRERALRCEQIQIPEFLIQRFEDASRVVRSYIPPGGAFPVNHGINAFLLHYKEDAAASTFSGDFLLEAPTQSPEQYIRMMKTTWIMQRVQESPDYKDACRNGNRLLKCFVEGLAQKCVDDFNRFAEAPPGNPFKVRNEPQEETLSPLEQDYFSIWPKTVQQPDQFDTASMDSLKVILRAPLQLSPTQYLAPTSSRHKEILLLRHDNNLLEMIIKETSQADCSTNSQSKNIDLSIVSLNPIYADPNSQSQAMYLSLNTMGNRGPHQDIGFRAYNDLYRFQWALTGYKPIMDLVDVDVVIHQDTGTQWRARVQLWDSQLIPAGAAQNKATPSSRRTSLAVSGTSSSDHTSRYSSRMSFQTKTSQVTAVTSLMDTHDDGNISIDATTFEPPKQPLLVLFLRPRRQRSHLPHLQHLSLMKVPLSDKVTYLETSNCACQQARKPECRHSELTGLKKMVGRHPLIACRYNDPTAMNLAILGAHHAKANRQPEQKLNYIGFTFKNVPDRELFDVAFRKYQLLYSKKMDAYEREKRSIRFPTRNG